LHLFRLNIHEVNLLHLHKRLYKPTHQSQQQHLHKRILTHLCIRHTQHPINILKHNP
jgi:hypothetical protein